MVLAVPASDVVNRDDLYFCYPISSSFFSSSLPCLIEPPTGSPAAPAVEVPRACQRVTLHRSKCVQSFDVEGRRPRQYTGCSTWLADDEPGLPWGVAVNAADVAGRVAHD